MWKQCQISFSWAPKSLWTVTAATKLRLLLFGRIAMTNLDSVLKSRDITLPTKVHLIKAMFFPVGHVWMWELAYKENWAPKNWCFWTVVLDRCYSSWGRKESNMMKWLNNKICHISVAQITLSKFLSISRQWFHFNFFIFLFKLMNFNLAYPEWWST